MSKYDFIIENIRFSYSNVSTFGTCKYGWKLTYIDHKDRSNNWYADFGTLMHSVLEQYFKGELETFELSSYYKTQYPVIVTSIPPPYPAGIADKYYENGLEFFENFDFDRDEYETIFIEDSIETNYQGFDLIIKPDLLLREKSTGKVILIDYKSSNPYDKKDRLNKKKFEGYRKQLYLYAYFIEEIRKIHIDEIVVWFVRIDKEERFDFDKDNAKEVVDWFFGEIKNIQEEEAFAPNQEKSNVFFCNMLCSVSSMCEYKPTSFSQSQPLTPEE